MQQGFAASGLWLAGRSGFKEGSVALRGLDLPCAGASNGCARTRLGFELGGPSWKLMSLYKPPFPSVPKHRVVQSTESF